jgi:hypothetical protein
LAGIAIEVIVVVLGVLIAFQIDQWGDRRKQGSRGAAVPCPDSMENTAAALPNCVKQTVSIMRSWPKCARSWLQGTHRPRSSTCAAGAFGCGIARQPLTTFNDTEYQELVASGASTPSPIRN